MEVLATAVDLDGVECFRIHISWIKHDVQGCAIPSIGLC